MKASKIYVIDNINECFNAFAPVLPECEYTINCSNNIIYHSMSNIIYTNCCMFTG